MMSAFFVLCESEPPQRGCAEPPGTISALAKRASGYPGVQQKRKALVCSQCLCAKTACAECNGGCGIPV